MVAQSRKIRGSKVRIAIIDTGIDLCNSHFDNPAEDLGATGDQETGPQRDRVKDCKRFIGAEAGDCDSVGHGTHCAALLLQLAPNADIYVARVTEKEEDYLDPKVVASVSPLRGNYSHVTAERKVGYHIRSQRMECRHHHHVIRLAATPTVRR